MNDFQNIQDVWTYLDQIPMFSKVGVSAANFGLNNIRKASEAIGNPHLAFKSIHIAGTNGKGTVTALLETIYSKADYKTGSFTSPHLLRYNERVKINGDEIPDELILSFFQQTRVVLNEIPLTFFEISTLLAFWVFAKEKVDVAIIEAGLGGRLDSTNIIESECAVITSIGLDHQQILGDTKEKIAQEKAGIIKNQKPVVVGNIFGSTFDEIDKIATEKNAMVICASALNPTWLNGAVTLNTLKRPIKTQFIEPINAHNIAITISVVDVLKEQLPIKTEQLINTIEAFPGVPARFEKMDQNKDWYFSGAHNVDALQSLFQGLQAFNNRNIIFVFSFLADKIDTEIGSMLNQQNHIYYFEMSSERAARKHQVDRFFSSELISEMNFQTILDDFRNEVVIFAGSFYFYPIVKRWLTQLN